MILSKHLILFNKVATLGELVHFKLSNITISYLKEKKIYVMDIFEKEKQNWLMAESIL